MKLYRCEKCGYETKVHTNFKNHLNRKKPCSSNDLATSATSGTTSATSGTTSATSGTTSATSGTTCEYCGKIFTRKNNLTQHLRMNRCKRKRKISDNSDAFTIDSDILEKIENIEKNMEQKEE